MEGCGRRVSPEPVVCALPPQLHISPLHICSDHITPHILTHYVATHRCKQTYTVTCTRHTDRHTNAGSWPLTHTTHSTGTLRPQHSSVHTMQCRTPRHSCTHTPYRHTLQSCDGRSTSMDNHHYGQWAQLEEKDVLEGLELLLSY